MLVNRTAVFPRPQEHPDLLLDLLKVLEPRVDHVRVIDLFRKQSALPLVKEYLMNVQKTNILEVNEAVNELLVEDEDFDALRVSISSHDNFDQLQLAQQLEKQELLEFRCVV